MTRVLDRLDEIYAIGQYRAGYSPEEDAAHALAATRVGVALSASCRSQIT